MEDAAAADDVAAAEGWLELMVTKRGRSSSGERVGVMRACVAALLWRGFVRSAPPVQRRVTMRRWCTATMESTGDHREQRRATAPAKACNAVRMDWLCLVSAAEQRGCRRRAEPAPRRGEERKRRRCAVRVASRCARSAVRSWSSPLVVPLQRSSS